MSYLIPESLKNQHWLKDLPCKVFQSKILAELWLQFGFGKAFQLTLNKICILKPVEPLKPTTSWLFKCNRANFLFLGLFEKMIGAGFNPKRSWLKLRKRFQKLT